MALKAASLFILVVTIAAEVHHPLFYQDSLAYVAAEGQELNVHDSYSLIRVDSGLFNPPFSVGGKESPWNYLVPIANSESSVPTSYPGPIQALPLAAPCTHDVPLAYPTTVTPTKAASRLEEIPFGYVPSVAKISAPPGYKIH